MIKVGDRVALIYHMSQTGSVVRITGEKPKSWFVGGVSGVRLNAHVKFDNDGEIRECKIEELMRLD